MLEAKMNKLMEQCDEVMNDMIKTSGLGLDDLASLNEEQFAMIKRYMQLWKDCKELSLEQARMMDKINAIDKKLDKLLEKK